MRPTVALIVAGTQKCIRVATRAFNTARRVLYFIARFLYFLLSRRVLFKVFDPAHRRRELNDAAFIQF